MSEPTPSGADLARAALAAARAHAKTQPTTKAKKPTRKTVQRTGRRDPQGLSAVIGQMMDERGWEPPEEGGSILDQWPQIAPELADKVYATRFTHDTGILYLQPLSAAYATQLRMFQRQILARIWEKTGQSVVRALRILPPGATPAADERPDVSAAAPVLPEPKTRATASPGYQHALQAHLDHRPEHGPTDPYLIAAIARQDAALRAHRLPGDTTVRQLETPDEAAQRHKESERARQAALAFKRGEEKNGPAPARRAFDVA
jgi:predicted nucleic acid-binding Zn ribbon protein